MTGRLEVEQVVKSYGDHRALDGVSLRVEPGEVCGLLGPNGAGKTTLVSIVAGLLVADEGAVRVDGMDVSSGGRAVRSRIGFAGQETAVYPTVTVRENLVLFADVAGLKGARRAERIDDVADALDLTELMGRQARHLSGGERRRLHTAMALVHRPALALLDEPTTGVDVATRQRLLATVRRIAADDGTAVVYSTHYLPEIEQLDANVVLIDRGRVLASGPVREMVGRHGGGVVEISLSAEPPAIDGAEVEVVAAGFVLRMRGAQPGALLARSMAQLGRATEHVVGVEVLPPSLETVFVELTGRRYRADEPSPQEGTHG